LESLSKLSAALAAVVVPIAIALVGHWYTESLEARQREERFVQLAVEILREDPSKHTENLRSWAVDVIDEYSGVPMPKEARREVIEQSPIPSGGVQSHVRTRSLVSDLDPENEYLRFTIRMTRGAMNDAVVVDSNGTIICERGDDRSLVECTWPREGERVSVGMHEIITAFSFVRAVSYDYKVERMDKAGNVTETLVDATYERGSQVDRSTTSIRITVR